MKWTGGNQHVVELDSSTKHDDPGPVYTALTGFPRHVDRVESLPLLEKIKLRVLTDFIVESFEPGCLPITGIHIIGHADTDAQKGKAFEQKISEARARNLQSYLKREVERNAPVSIIRLPPDTPTVSTIEWKTPKGVGATEPHPENKRRRKTPANMTEEDRKRNRRVEIILEPGLIPIPDALALGKTSPGPSPDPPIPNLPPSPPPVGSEQQRREWLKDALQRDPIIRSLPSWIRDKAIDGLKDADELAAEKIIDALPLDSKVKAAVQASVKSILQMLKGKKFQPPTPQPPQYQQPPSTAPEVPKAPGETIFQLPPIRF